jgi:hypothetical protein
MRRTILVGFVTVLVSLFVNGLVTLAAIDRLEQTILDSNKATEPTVIVTKEVQTVTVTREDYDCGCIVFEYGDIYDESYFYTIVNVEQGVYEYYWPAADLFIEYDSLAELNESITCHIDQEWPNATFVTVSR